MRRVVTLAMLLFTAPLLAQRGGGGGGGDFGGGGDGGARAVVRSPFDQLVEELDLNRQTQVPAVTALLDGTEREATALFQELIGLRQQMLNVETNRRTDPAPAAAYAAATTKVIALEAKVFAGIYAQLTPKQKEKAAKGFDRLETLFKSLSVSSAGGPGGRAGRSGPGGGGRGMPPQGGGR